MKVTSLRYLDAKFHHPSPKIKKKSQKYQRTVGYPSTSWASCFLSHIILEIQTLDYRDALVSRFVNNCRSVAFVNILFIGQIVIIIINDKI